MTPGSAFMDKQGRAFGILSTLALAPIPGSNGVGDITKELRTSPRTRRFP